MTATTVGLDLLFCPHKKIGDNSTDNISKTPSRSFYVYNHLTDVCEKVKCK
jgi:hypothetical protein